MGKLIDMTRVLKSDIDMQRKLVEFTKDVESLFEKHGIEFGVVSGVVRTKVGDTYRAAASASSYGLRNQTHNDFQNAADAIGTAVDRVLGEAHRSCADGCPDNEHQDDDIDNDDTDGILH
jgi:hypothetical protein